MKFGILDNFLSWKNVSILFRFIFFIPSFLIGELFVRLKFAVVWLNENSSSSLKKSVEPIDNRFLKLSIDDMRSFSERLANSDPVINLNWLEPDIVP